jgi:hypothetical protein
LAREWRYCLSFDFAWKTLEACRFYSRMRKMTAAHRMVVSLSLAIALLAAGEPFLSSCPPYSVVTPAHSAPACCCCCRPGQCHCMSRGKSQTHCMPGCRECGKVPAGNVAIVPPAQRLAIAIPMAASSLPIAILAQNSGRVFAIARPANVHSPTLLNLGCSFTV